MESNGRSKKWKFSPNAALMNPYSVLSIRAAIEMILPHVGNEAEDDRPLIAIGNGDPSAFPCFRITREAEDAVIASLRSANFNGYAPYIGLPVARRAIAEYQSRDLPYKLSMDDVYLTSGCTQAIDVVNSVLARPGANILLPRPSYLVYEERATFSGIEIRHFDLLMDKGCEIDLERVEALADDNTVAIVIVNPGNPCAYVYTYEHLAMVANLAKKLGILVISDEVYGHLTFGRNPFVPMGVFSHIVPVLTLGSLSKRWAIPGWRLGWIVTNDPNGVLKETKIVDCIKNYIDNSAFPPTFVQAAVPQILNIDDCYFKKTTDILRQTANTCYEKLKEIDHVITCPHKPESSMFVMVKLKLDQLEDIEDDIDFSCKLAKEERVIILPGYVFGMKNWLRIMFGVEPASLEGGLARLKSFCLRHSKQGIANCAGSSSAVI